MSGYRTPKVEALNAVLEMIIGDYASAKPAAAPAVAATHRAIYLDRADVTVASCRCDIGAAAGLSCALSMIPPAGCEDMAASGELTAMALSNLNEVMNIFSNLFMDDHSAHLRLRGVDTDVAEEVPAGAADVVFDLELGRYGKGQIAFRHV